MENAQGHPTSLYTRVREPKGHNKFQECSQKRTWHLIRHAWISSRVKRPISIGRWWMNYHSVGCNYLYTTLEGLWPTTFNPKLLHHMVFQSGYKIPHNSLCYSPLLVCIIFVFVLSFMFYYARTFIPRRHYPNINIWSRIRITTTQYKLILPPWHTHHLSTFDWKHNFDIHVWVLRYQFGCWRCIGTIPTSICHNHWPSCNKWPQVTLEFRL